MKQESPRSWKSQWKRWCTRRSTSWVHRRLSQPWVETAAVQQSDQESTIINVSLISNCPQPNRAFYLVSLAFIYTPCGPNHRILILIGERHCLYATCERYPKQKGRHDTQRGPAAKVTKWARQGPWLMPCNNSIWGIPIWLELILDLLGRVSPWDSYTSGNDAHARHFCHVTLRDVSPDQTP